jgi:hypothetical protein
MIKKGKLVYVVAVLIFAAVTLSFRPGMWLVHKPASTQSEHYVKGWEDGCISGTNSYSLLYAPLLEKPFIKDISIATAGKDTAKDSYKSGWNEGFTLCRFYQASVYELMQFTLVILTLLFIGYLLARRK